MQISDCTGDDTWSDAEIIKRYKALCVTMGIAEPQDISITATENAEERGYSVIGKVIAGIEKGDLACARIGIEFIEDDATFPFSKVVKSNTARALRQPKLDDTDKERLRKRIVGMLVTGQVPHEFKQYARLLKQIGVGEHWDAIESKLDRSNEWAVKYYEYLKKG